MLLRRLSLGLLLLLVAGCATTGQRRYPTPFDVNDGMGPVCGDEAKGFNWFTGRFRLSCIFTSGFRG